jgi:Tol biopolymer transport system component
MGARRIRYSEGPTVTRSSALLAVAGILGLAGITSLGLVGCGETAARATFPARNGRIAFQADKGSGYEIYTIKPNGTGLRRLTHVKGNAIEADWSPDGSQIAFTLNDCRTVAIMRANGTHRRVLPQATPKDCEGDPSFTPDGSRLVYLRYLPPHDNAVWSMNLNGTDRQRITAPRVGGPDPNVSPNGQKISFLRGKHGGEQNALFTASLDGSNVFRVTPYMGVGFKQDWAPNGRHIVISTHVNSRRSANVATVRPDGSHLRMLTHYKGGEKAALAGSYSPNGRWIVFRFENSKREKFRLLKMRPNGTHRKLIRKFPFATSFIDWGPRP